MRWYDRWSTSVSAETNALPGWAKAAWKARPHLDRAE